MVTAELAIATLAVLAVVTMMCWAIFLLVMQMRCIDTAGEVARQAARGDQTGVQRAERDAPTGVRVSVTTNNQVISVTVRLTARPFSAWLVAVPLHAQAEVVAEPGITGHR
ncbi:MAG: hypothetical protein QOF35_1604 [Actinomycetota bacterium]|jgi:hypothetical protein|nr:hypothetical protein [Actinomycetota bacterium]